jgi:hypothetical protein
VSVAGRISYMCPYYSIYEPHGGYADQRLHSRLEAIRTFSACCPQMSDEGLN